jgi:putative ABC transport system permease protein
MAKSQGINTTVTTIICVSISNALIGLAGALIAQIDSGMNAQGATGYLVVGLASILIGETLFGKRSFKNALISISLGSILYFAIIMLATQVFKMPTDLTKLLYAFLIALALCLPMIKQAILKLWARISPPIKRFFKKLFVRKKKKEAE